MADVAGPDVYASFTYAATDGNLLARTFARFNGSTWTLYGAPEGTEAGAPIAGVQQMTHVDDTLVVLATGYAALAEYIYRYSGGDWSVEPVGYDVGERQWVDDWLVNGPSDIWLYGGKSTNADNAAWCDHFTGGPLTGAPCVAGTGGEISAATRLDNGSHVVGSSLFNLLTQPNKQSVIPSSLPVDYVVDLATEPGTNIVWAVAGNQVLRYGVAADAAPFVVTAKATAKVKVGATATISGKVTPAVVSGERGVELQVKAGTTWKKVAAKNTSATGAYSFAVKETVVGTFSYRVKKLATADRKVAYSPTVKVVVVK